MHKIDRRDMLKGAATAMVLGAMPGGRDVFAAERPSESTASACDYFDKNFGVGRELLRQTLEEGIPEKTLQAHFRQRQRPRRKGKEL